MKIIFRIAFIVYFLNKWFKIYFLEASLLLSNRVHSLLFSNRRFPQIAMVIILAVAAIRKKTKLSKNARHARATVEKSNKASDWWAKRQVVLLLLRIVRQNSHSTSKLFTLVRGNAFMC